MADLKICSVDGCCNKQIARGLCNAHYKRNRRHGAPTLGRTKNGEQLDFIFNNIINFSGDDCLIWPFLRSRAGYGRTWNGDRMIDVHRWVCKIVNGPPPTPEHEAAHSCGNGHLACCSPRHLRWATKAENESDKLRHGTAPIGDKNPMAKFTDQQILEMRKLDGMMRQREIASIFDCSQSTVCRILASKGWIHL
jgi:hypothetical protein